MNFFAHVAVATYFSDDVAYGLGAMLPDFAGILGLRKYVTLHPSIAEGVRLHQRTDGLFHDVRAFREACHLEAAYLRSLGIARGPATAAAHVGLELLLDDALALDAPTQELFTSSLGAAGPTGLGQHLDFPSRKDAEAFEGLRLRLLSASPSPTAIAPELLAERIDRTLRKRPRLAIRSEDVGLLVTWAKQAQRRNNQDFPGIVEQVLDGLSDVVGTYARPRANCLQFRRAQC